MAGNRGWLSGSRLIARSRLDVVAAAGLLALIGAGIGVLALSRPATVPTTKPVGYTHSGQLSYSAQVDPNSVYGTSEVRTGEPVFGSLVKTVTLNYAYHFQISTDVRVAGTEQLVATISNGIGLSRVIDLQPVTPFSGDQFQASAPLSMLTLGEVASAFQQATGQSGGSYQVAISPTVALHGRDGSASVATSFDAPITFTYQGGTLQPPSTTSSGAGGPASGASQANPMVVTSSGSATMPARTSNVLFLHLPVADARDLGLAILLVSLVVGGVAALSLRRDAVAPSEAVRISARYGSLLVSAKALPEALTVGVELEGIEDLVQVARQLQVPVLHAEHPVDSYGVVDNGIMYTYRTEPRPVSIHEPAPTRPGVVPDRRRSGRGVRRAAGGGAERQAAAEEMA